MSLYIVKFYKSKKTHGFRGVVSPNLLLDSTFTRLDSNVNLIYVVAILAQSKKWWRYSMRFSERGLILDFPKFGAIFTMASLSIETKKKNKNKNQLINSFSTRVF